MMDFQLVDIFLCYCTIAPRCLLKEEHAVASIRSDHSTLASPCILKATLLSSLLPILDPFDQIVQSRS